MLKLQPVPGTHDLLPEAALRHRHVVETAYAVARSYGYQPIDTPIIEFTEVFRRTLGDTSDIVTKEMYAFTDKGGDNLTLRPEGTAGVVRALIGADLKQELPVKLFYAGPMFRRERPQKGRQRQFHQIGVELLGVEMGLGDAEVIALGADVLRALGVADKAVLHINTLGDSESRRAYRDKLVDFLRPYGDQLSADSQLRLETNPLRTLDSKDAGDRRIIADAPRIEDSLTGSARETFARVLGWLDDAGVAYQIDQRLVRGLDYYCDTAFEFVTDALGAQGTILAGGRYDGLAETMGGRQMPGIGWAAGVERLAMLVADPPSPPRPIWVVPIAPRAEGAADDRPSAEERAAWRLVQELRRSGLAAEIGFGGSLRFRLNKASKEYPRSGKRNARAAVLLGEDERARGVATVRDMDTGQQSEVPLDALARHLAAFR